MSTMISNSIVTKMPGQYFSTAFRLSLTMTNAIYKMSLNLLFFHVLQTLYQGLRSELLALTAESAVNDAKGKEAQDMVNFYAAELILQLNLTLINQITTFLFVRLSERFIHSRAQQPRAKRR